MTDRHREVLPGRENEVHVLSVSRPRTIRSSTRLTDEDQPLAFGRIGLANGLLGGTESIPSGLDDVLLDLLTGSLLEVGDLLVELRADEE